MFPEGTFDRLLTDRAGTRCLFKVSKLTQVKKIQEKINCFRTAGGEPAWPRVDANRLYLFWANTTKNNGSIRCN